MSDSKSPSHSERTKAERKAIIQLQLLATFVLCSRYLFESHMDSVLIVRKKQYWNSLVK